VGLCWVVLVCIPFRINKEWFLPPFFTVKINLLTIIFFLFLLPFLRVDLLGGKQSFMDVLTLVC